MHAETSPFTISVPRIATARLLLREFRVQDFEKYAENLADPEASIFTTGADDRRTAWRMFCAQMGQWVLQGKGWWALELKATREVVGSVGAFVRESPTEAEVELGWTVYRRFWGQGYATEAAAAARDFSFDGHHARRVLAHITAANAASVAVSEKLGMAYEKDVDFYGEPICRYVLERPLSARG